MDKTKREIFRGFPYLVTRIAGALHHLIVLPKRPEDELEALAWMQSLTNQLPTCLVLAPDRALYLDGSAMSWSAEPPWCDFPVCDRVKGVGSPDDPELDQRRAQLREFSAARKSDGYLVDLPRGRRPTPAEYERLSRRSSDGVPAGLEPCEECSGYRGIALLDGPGVVVDVFCFCDAENRCARCGGLLSDRRLNACSYFEDEQSVLHVPAFVGLSHECLPDSGPEHGDRIVLEVDESGRLKASFWKV